jgi:hypothetical protein
MNYFLGCKDINQPDLGRQSRIAVFADPIEHLHNFAETVFVNNAYRCGILTDEGPAVDSANSHFIAAMMRVRIPSEKYYNHRL